MNTPYTILALITLSCLFYAFRFLYLIRKSKELVKKATPFETPGDLTSLPFFFVGDSTAVGVGSNSPKETVAGYFSQDFPHRPIKNLSTSGRKTEELIPILQSQADKSAEWVFIQIGGNDILYFTPLKKLAYHIKEVLQESKRIGAHVVLLTSGNIGNAPFFPLLISGIWAIRTKRIRNLFMNTAKKQGVLYVDLFQSRNEDLFLTDVSHFYSDDLLHPSGAGYRYWYQNIRETIKNSALESELIPARTIKE